MHNRATLMEHDRFIATLTSPRLGAMSNIARKIKDVKPCDIINSGSFRFGGDFCNENKLF
jgi:hypothetical protein